MNRNVTSYFRQGREPAGKVSLLSLYTEHAGVLIGEESTAAAGDAMPPVTIVCVGGGERATDGTVC